ncbi:MAG: putative amino-acid metabolite efflux pump [Firmicutes bacterium ADurb.Bin099]|jgi:drug/metabolite transporter (DMT)-like permease|nr:MAG: putative amino-acid metabolite efflux pump [Firmicutes bacterium ADurb.Bin099]
MDRKSKFWAHFTALITIIVWGSTFIASRFMLDCFTPLQVMIMRFLLAYIVLVLIKPKFTKIIWKDEAIFILMGLTGCSLYFIAEYKALTMTSASNVSIIVASSPILIALLAHIFTKDEKLKINTIAGFVIAFVGVAFVVFNGTFILKLNPLGDLLAFLSALSWAVYSLILKKIINRYDNILLIRKVMFYGIVTTAPFLLLEGKPFDFAAFSDPKLIISILFLGVVGSGLCYMIWNIPVRTLGITITNSYIYAIPFVTMILAATLLKEKITALGVLGAMLIILGVVITGSPKNLLKTGKSK